MLTSSMGYKGAISAPHRAAALAGRDILNAGGTAIEAMPPPPSRSPIRI